MFRQRLKPVWWFWIAVLWIAGQGGWAGKVWSAEKRWTMPGDFAGVVIDHSPASSGIYLGSPALVVLPDGAYLAKCDEFGPKSAKNTQTVSRLYRSEDGGRTWQQINRLEGLNWANVFVHRRVLYAMGTDKAYGSVIIRKSTDGGRTWTRPADENSGLLLDDAKYHTAAVPVVEHAGRLWRAMEDGEGPGGWGSHFRAFMMSAPADADLLQADSWTCSNRLGGDPKWLDGRFGGWLEGNAVVTPGNELVNVLRVDYRPDGGKAAVVHVSADGETATFDAGEDFIDLPGGCKKFTIRYDARSKLYWTLSNAILPKHRGGNPERTRNAVALMASADVRNWTVRDIVLYHPDVHKHGFQYLDWRFEDEAIIAVSRTAYDDGLGGADNQHNANYLTFHRFENFRTRRGGVVGDAGRPKRPNILILMTDQQRFDALGCTGSKAAHTPNIDRLAREGVLFEHCYVSNPICTPSRCSMLTGKTVPAHGLYRLYDNLPDDQILFTKYLQQAGYRTALFGKLHISGRLEEARRRHPNDGFDIYEWCIEPSIHIDSPFNGYTRWLKKKAPAFYERLKREGRELHPIPRHLHMTHWAAEQAIDLINSSSSERPFFGVMSVFDPHNPYHGYPPEMAKLVDEEDIKDPILETGNEPPAVQRERQKSHLGKFENFSLKELRTMRRDYHATIAFFDEEVGRVLRALDEKGIADNTLVIVTSDGGDMLGDHKLLAKGAFLYDSSIRVPLLMRWPEKIPAGKKISELTQLQDLAATVLSAAGLLTESLQGGMPESRDLLSLTNGQVQNWRDYAVCTYRNTGITVEGIYSDPPIHATMIRTKNYKLVAYLNPPGHKECFDGQLFDMASDSHELNNLWDSADHQAIKLDLMTRLAEWETRQELLLGSRGGGQVPGPAEKLDNRLKK